MLAVLVHAVPAQRRVLAIRLESWTDEARRADGAPGELGVEQRHYGRVLVPSNSLELVALLVLDDGRLPHDALGLLHLLLLPALHLLPRRSDVRLGGD